MNLKTDKKWPKDLKMKKKDSWNMSKNCKVKVQKDNGPKKIGRSESTQH